MAITAPTLQTRFTTTMKTEFAEFKGGRLRGLAQKQIGKGNEKVRFYVSKPGTTSTSIDKKKKKIALYFHCFLL